MGKILWTTFVFGAGLATISYLGYDLISVRPIAKKASDPLEGLLEKAPESFPSSIETGSGKFAEEKKVEAPKVAVNEEPLQDISSDAAIHSALFQKPTFKPNSANPEDLQRAREQTQQQLNNIERELAQLPGGPESAPARSVLLHTASTLDLNEQEADAVHELAMNELLQPFDDRSSLVASSSSFAYFLPVLAHEVALKTALDSGEALSITLDGVLVHHDPTVRYSIVRQFVSRYPDLEPQLREELYIRNIRTDALIGEFSSN